MSKYQDFITAYPGAKPHELLVRCDPATGAVVGARIQLAARDGTGRYVLSDNCPLGDLPTQTPLATAVGAVVLQQQTQIDAMTAQVAQLTADATALQTATGKAMTDASTAAAKALADAQAKAATDAAAAKMASDAALADVRAQLTAVNGQLGAAVAKANAAQAQADALAETLSK